MHGYASLIFLIFPVALLYMFFSRTRRQQRAFTEVQASIEPGAQVMTTSGVYGTVISMDDPAIVVLEVAPGVHMRWARPAIAKVIDANDGPEPQNDSITLPEHEDVQRHDELERDDRTLT